MKRIIIAMAAVLAASCSYKQKICDDPTVLNIEMAVVQSNYASVSITPSDDRVYYLAECIERDKFDRFVSQKSEDVLMETIVDSTVLVYNEWRAGNISSSERYVASYEDFQLYYAKNTLNFLRLKPETDYYAIAFCVNFHKRSPMGSLQKVLFHTAAIPTDVKDICFDFMFRSIGGHNFCYVRPTIGGKLCLDPYFSGYVEWDVLHEKFHDSVVEYMESLSEVYEKYLEHYLDFDIKRSMSGYMDDFVPGKKYLFFAFPYTNSAQYADSVYTLTFTYEEGMYIAYSHDPK